MFGYIRPRKSELLVREYEQYKGVYCSLCRQLGKSYGVLSRLALSYDCTFYAMVSMGLSAQCPGFSQGRCVVNPLKKCTYCNGGTQSLTMAAALTVIMTYHKVKDDIHDSQFWGRCRAYFLLPLVSGARKKAAKDFPELERVVSSAMELQNRTEREPNPSLDACAEPTASMLSGVFAVLGEKGSPLERVLSQFGYFLGRWVYLIDAADDLEKDFNSGAFNPFLRAYALESASPDFNAARAKCNQALNLTLSQIISAMNLMEFHYFGPVLRNIIFQGLPQMQKERLFKTERENENV